VSPRMTKSPKGLCRSCGGNMLHVVGPVRSHWRCYPCERRQASVRRAGWTEEKRRTSRKQIALKTLEWNKRNRVKRTAHKAVCMALKSGVLVREICIVCGIGETQAHHEDYSHPLDVVWLCRAHHAARHVALRDQARSSQYSVSHGVVA
jgi:hypothetical protein